MISFKLILKLAVSIGCFYLVSRSVVWADVLLIIKEAKFSLIIIALIIFWIAQFFCSLRCIYIAQVLGGTLNLRTSVHAHFVGLLFNQVMPTNLGGDLIKIAILKKSLGLGMAIRAAILERASGFMLLLLITFLTLPIYSEVFSSYPKFTQMLGVIVTFGGLLICLSAWIAHNASKCWSNNGIFIKLIQVLSDMWQFRKGRRLWNQVWTSSIAHFTGIIMYGLIGIALDVNIDAIAYLLVVPVISLITLIPFSIAGWGIREAGAVWLFGMVGVPADSALSMSVVFGLLLAFAGLPGAILLVKN